MPFDRAAILAEARELIGTPWVDEGRLKGVACDCIGVPVLVGRARGFVTGEIGDRAYGRLPHGGQLEREMEKHLDRVPDGEMLAGDVLLMKWRREPMHLGILGNYRHADFTAPFSLIHAALEFGKVVEHRLDEAWAARIVSAWCFRESA